MSVWEMLLIFGLSRAFGAKIAPDKPQGVREREKEKFLQF